MEKVSVWQEEVLLPTYPALAAEKDPMFLEKRAYQGSTGKVYPLPVTERLSDEKQDVAYKAVFLENEYLKVMILPELGGRIHRAYDKTNHYDFVYYNHVVKPALVGLTGPWISGSIEFNWPQHHRPSTYSPVDFTFAQNPDGSCTVYLSEIDKMYGTKGTAAISLYPGKAYIEIAGLTGNGGKFETNASFDEDDVVLYTVADGDIQTVTMAKKIEDQEVTSKTGDTKFVADGETYKYNKNHRTYDITLKSSVDIYTDNYGYVVYVEEYEAGSASVAFVLNFKTNNEGWDGDTDKTYTAKLLLTDGTVIEADTDDKNPSAFKNKFVSYTVDDDGIYTLKAKDVTSDAGDSIYLTKGTSKFDINGTNNKGGERYANSSTIFLVYDEEEKEYSVYTGIANVPSMDGKATVYVNSKDGKPGSVAKYVFISAASDVVSDSNKAQIYILAGSQSKLISDSEKGDYYTYDAVIDGKITTVDVEKDYAEKNIKNDIVASRLTINSKDVVTKITEYENDTKKDDYYISGVGTKKTTDGTVGLTQNGSTTYYTYAKDVVVFRIEDDEFNTSSINSVRDSDDAFKAIVKDGEVVALFITENGKDGGKPDIKSDFKFDSISASREENGTVKVTASCADIDDWNLKDAVIEFTVSKNNGDEQTFTKNLSGVKSYADVMNALTVPGLTISANSTGTYDVSVLITFKGDNADTNTYTVSGSCSFTIA